MRRSRLLETTRQGLLPIATSPLDHFHLHTEKFQWPPSFLVPLYLTYEIARSSSPAQIVLLLAYGEIEEVEDWPITMCTSKVWRLGRSTSIPRWIHCLMGQTTFWDT